MLIISRSEYAPSLATNTVSSGRNSVVLESDLKTLQWFEFRCACVDVREDCEDWREFMD